MTTTEMIDRRIADLESRLDELRALRRLMEPATIDVLPDPEIEQEAEPTKVPAPNAVRRAAVTPPAGDRKLKTPTGPDETRKPGSYLTALQRERAVAMAQVLANGPLTCTELQEATKLSSSAVQEVLRCCGFPAFAYPNRSAAVSYFLKQDGNIRSPWQLTDLGRRELLSASPATLSTTVAAALDMWEQLYGKKVRQ